MQNIVPVRIAATAAVAALAIVAPGAHHAIATRAYRQAARHAVAATRHPVAGIGHGTLIITTATSTGSGSSGGIGWD